MNLIDTHTHLYSEQYNEDRAEMIQRAIEAGINRFYLPAISSKYYPDMLSLKEKYPEKIFLMVGIHPCDVKEDTYEKEITFVEEKLKESPFAGIGEIGLDLHWDKTTLEIQKIAFKRQIALAKEYKLPIIIHVREAFDEMFEILEEEKSDDLYGIVHCFSGDLAEAKKCIALGFALGIGGIVTYKKCILPEILKEIPLEHIVLETDAPFLAPTPYRGKRNETAYIIHVAEKLSDIYEIHPDEIARITSENALKIFNQ